DEDLFKVPTYAFGQDEYERQALIHESVHAYYDIIGKDTLALWDESIAYLAGALFSLYYERPGAAPAVPSWRTGGVCPAAFRIALPVYGQANRFVSPTDGYKLETAVLADDAYRKWMDRTTIYQRNGVGRN